MKRTFYVIAFLIITSAGAFGQSVSLSTNAVLKGGTVMLSWSGFPGNVNIKFYKGNTFVTYANANVPGAGSQALVMTNYEVRADYWVRVELRSNTSIFRDTPQFSVNDPSVSISPSSVPYGGSATVSWTGFASNVNLKFYKGSTFVTYANTNVPGTGSQPLNMSGFEARNDYRVLVELRSNVNINRFSNYLTVGSPPQPDLSITGLSGISGVRNKGQDITASVTVSRTGGQLTSGSYVEVKLYASLDNNITTGDTEIGSGNYSNSTLNSSGSLRQDLRGTTSGLVAGNYYIGAIVDPSNYHSESNEGNNSRSNGSVTIIGELTVRSPGSGDTWTAGSQQTVRWDYSRNLSGECQIQLYKGSSALDVLGRPSVSLGSYSVTVPTGLSAGNDYKISLSAMSGQVWAYGDAFRIEGGQLVLSSLSGTVTDALTNAPISGASINLEINNNIVETRISGAGGFFKFENIEPGDYFLSASRTGYQNWRKPIKISESTNYKDYQILMTPVGIINAAPFITNPQISPSTILVNSTQVEFSITYQDQENNPPAIKRLDILEPGEISWSTVGQFEPVSDNFIAGSLFKIRVNKFAKTGSYRARAVFNDGYQINNILVEFASFNVIEDNPDQNKVPMVVSTIPNQNAEIADPSPMIMITYNVAIQPQSLEHNLTVVGSKSGSHFFTKYFSNSRKTINIEITDDFVDKEIVTVILRKSISSANGVLQGQDYFLQFRTAFSNNLSSMTLGNIVIAGDNFVEQNDGSIEISGNINFNQSVYLDQSAKIIVSPSRKEISGNGTLKFRTSAGNIDLLTGAFIVNVDNEAILPLGNPSYLLEKIAGFSLSKNNTRLEINLLQKEVKVKTKFILDVKGARVSLDANATIHDDYSIEGSIENFSFQVAGVFLTCNNVILTDKYIKVGSAQLTLADNIGIGSAQVGGMTIYPDRIIVNKAGMKLDLGQVKIDGLVELTTRANGDYIFRGEGAIEIAGIFETRQDRAGLRASFEIWSEGLNSAELYINAKVPIGATGFYLTSVGGSIEGLQESKREFSFKADFVGGTELPAIGYVINGNDGQGAENNNYGNDFLGAHLTVRWRPNVEIEMQSVVELVRYITASGTLYYKNNTRNFGGTVAAQVNLPLITISGDLDLNVWYETSNTYFAASGNVQSLIKKDAFSFEWGKGKLWGVKFSLLDEDIRLSSTFAQVGPYRHPELGNIEYGLHGYSFIPKALRWTIPNSWLDEDGNLHYFIQQDKSLHWKHDAEILGEAIFGPPKISNYRRIKKFMVSSNLPSVYYVSGVKHYKREKVRAKSYQDISSFLVQDKTYALFVTGSLSKQISVSVVDPSGYEFTPNNLPSDSSIKYFSQNGLTYYDVSKPKSGLWQLKVDNISDTSRYMIRVYGGEPLPSFGFLPFSKKSDESYSLNWESTNSDSATFLSLFWDTDNSGFDGRLIRTLPVSEFNSFNWDLSGLSSGKYFIYGVLKKNSYIVSKYSPESIDYIDPTKPKPPVGFTTSVVQQAVKIHFLQNIESDVVRYDLYYGNRTNQYDKSISLGLSNYSTIPISSSDTLFMAVKAIDASGNESEFSDEEIVFTKAKADTVLPLPPRTVDLQIVNEKQIRIAWEQSTSPDTRGYTVYWGTSFGQYDRSVDIEGSNELVIGDNINGLTYHFAISTYDSSLNWGEMTADYSILMVSSNDEDFDGFPDDWEYAYWGSLDGTNLKDEDFDEDGLTNWQELLAKLNPVNGDTDKDKIPDGVDLHPAMFYDYDGDNMPDDWETFYNLSDPEDDPDNDGLINVLEYKYSCSPYLTDSDGDGVGDGEEVRTGTDPSRPDSNYPPTIASIPDTTFMVGDTLFIDLNKYVSDKNDPDSLLIWTVNPGFVIKAKILGDKNFAQFISTVPFREYFVFTASDPNGLADSDTVLVSAIQSTKVIDEAHAVSRTYALSQNYPNPFNPTTTITYELPRPGEVEIRVYNLNGQIVKTLVKGNAPAGRYDAVFDGRSDSGQLLPSGTYLYEMRAGDFRAVKKLVLMK